MAAGVDFISTVWAAGIADILKARARKNWREDVAAAERDGIAAAEKAAELWKVAAVAVAALVLAGVVYRVVR